MKDINKNEKRALEAICADCDNLDGWGFTRLWDMCEAVAQEFKYNYQVAGGYIKALMDKRLIDVDKHDDEVWVRPEVYELFA